MKINRKYLCNYKTVLHWKDFGPFPSRHELTQKINQFIQIYIVIIYNTDIGDILKVFV